MNWRTDKPTADVIVAEDTKHDDYIILHRSKKGRYYYGDGILFPMEFMGKWADLEEDEMVTDCNELEKELETFYCDEMSLNPQRFNHRISGKDKLLPFCVMWEELLKIARHFAKWGMEHKEQPTIDENELEKAAERFAKERIPHLVYPKLTNTFDAFIAGAKWGAEHLKK